jgi:cytoskeletal protein RodZ
MEMNQPIMETASSPKKMWMWLVIGAVIIVALAAVWWFWQVPAGPVGADSTTAALEQQGTSDEVAAIDADLQATDLDDLDAELDAIDAELAQ